MDNRRAGDFVSTSTILLVSHLIFPRLELFEAEV